MLNALATFLTARPSSRFVQSPYAYFRYDATWLVLCLTAMAVMALTGWTPLSTSFSWWYLAAMPVLTYGFIWAHLLIHNATHGNFPKSINRSVGELLGFLVVVRFASWDIIHMRHHRYSDDRVKDPHPNFPSFWKTVFHTIVHVEQQLFQQYFDTWGDTPETRRREQWRARLSYGANIVLVAFWFYLLGPWLFLLAFAPANLLAGLFVIHFNWSTHNGEAAKTIEDMHPVNLSSPRYRIGNLLFCGIYAHQTHHDKPYLFNPARAARLMVQTDPPANPA